MKKIVNNIYYGMNANLKMRLKIKKYIYNSIEMAIVEKSEHGKIIKKDL